MASINLENIGKQWGATHALQGISLQVKAGSFCVLLGPSGCGKSTTLRMVAGLDRPTRGTVTIDGRDVTHMPPSRRGISMVFQNYALFPHLSVADNITFGLQVRHAPPDERARRLKETAELLGLTPLLARKPSQLSGGQQQRVALGRALVAGARVCLMDEPLSNLDAQLRQDMRRELRALQQQLGLTVVYVTHDQAEAMSMADQVVLLNQGRIEQAASARTLYERPASTFAARFIGTPPMNLLAVESGRLAGGALPVELPSAATHIGVRPEAIALAADDAAGSIAAKVVNTEYLGADLVLVCDVGGQPLLVRAGGEQQAQVGECVRLCWSAADTHAFNAEGCRIEFSSQPV